MKATIVVLVLLGCLQSAFSKLDCQAKLIEKCQMKQKEMYEKGNPKTDEDWKKIYCKNSQALMDCIVGNPEEPCQGDEINKYRYTNLEYNIMSQRTGLCPSLRTNDLDKVIPKELKLEHEGIDDLGGDQGSTCAKEIHWQCMKGLLFNLHNPEANLCQAVKTFMNCYAQSERSEEDKCKSKLLNHFRHILKNLNQEVLSDVDGRSEMAC